MRYSDEGNLRFSGNIRASSVEPTPSQGYYRDELDYGKYSITLTNSEPGLGYFGFNKDELTYDIDNHALCTKNVHVNGDIISEGNASFEGNISLTGDIISEGNALFEGDITSDGCLLVNSVTSYGNATVTGCLNVDNNVTVSGTIDSTGDICTDGMICSTGCIISGNNLSVSGDISSAGNITTLSCTIQGLTGKFSTLCSTNNCLCYLNLGNPGNTIIRDKCNTLVLGAYDGSLYLHGACYKVAEAQYDTNCESYIDVYSGQIKIKNKSTLGETRVQLNNNDYNKGSIILSTCCNGCSMGLCLVDNKAIFKPSYTNSCYMELDANSISTSCACLLLNNAVCVPDIFTMGTGSSTKCHYIHTISQNGTSATSSDGTLTLGAAVTNVTVNGVTNNVCNDGSITLPNLVKSITVSNVTCNVDSNGSITLPNLARCVAINGVSGCADATGKVDLGTLTAVLTVNLKGSAIISDSNTIDPDRIYNSVVMGKNAAQADPMVDTCNNVFVGYNVKGNGCHNIAIGDGAYAGDVTCAPKWAISIGCGAGTYEDDGIAIGGSALSESNDAIAIGDAADAGGEYSVAIGCGAAADACGIAIGCAAYASNGTCGSTSMVIRSGSIAKAIIDLHSGMKECDIFTLLKNVLIFNNSCGTQAPQAMATIAGGFAYYGTSTGSLGTLSQPDEIVFSWYNDNTICAYTTTSGYNFCWSKTSTAVCGQRMVFDVVIG